MRVFVPLVALGIILTACTSGPSQSDVVAVLANQSIVPSLEESVAQLDTLHDDVTSFCAGPEPAGRAALTASWKSAKSAWEAVEAVVPFGPASILRTVSMVNYQPISEAGIDELLASDESIDADYLANRSSATRRGLGSIEYTLLGPQQEGLESSCQLAVATAEVAAKSVAELAEAWTVAHDGGPPYVQTFIEEMAPRDSMGDVVGAMVETLKQQSLFEVGVAIGVTAAEADPLAIPEGHAGFGAGRYLAQLDSIEDVLRAGGEGSLLVLIESRSGEVAAEIEATLEAARQEMLGFSEPLRSVADSSPESLEPFLSYVTTLRTLLEADVVSLLDITLGFSDSDGDTG